VAQPRDADPVADGEARSSVADGVDASDDLVAGHGVGPVHGEVALDEVEVGAAHPADRDADAHLATARFRLGQVGERERCMETGD